MNKAIKRGFAAVAAAGALAMGAMAPAHAELPAEVAAATTQAKADVKEAGGLILGVIVVIAGVAWIRRVVK